ncbi:MAG: hypothetical protein OXI57_04375 [Rhodospirillales bacterium]|nr:hypothetical protein [Rhodospirillales bacterium]
MIASEAYERHHQRLFIATRLLWLSMIGGQCYWFYSMYIRAPVIFDGCSWYTADRMSFTSSITVIISLLYSVVVDRNHHRLMSEWQRAGILKIDATKWKDIRLHLSRTQLKTTTLALGSIVVVMFAGFGWEYYLREGKFENTYTYVCNGTKLQLKGEESLALHIEFLVATAVAVLLIGLRLGRLVTHGLLGQALRRHEIQINLVVEHPDRTGGLARIGDFYLLQCFVIVPVAAWLSVWLYFVPELGRYEGWLPLLYLTIPLVAASFIAIFWLPMLSFRSAIREWKREYVDHKLEEKIDKMLSLTRAFDLSADDLVRRRILVDYVHSLNSLPDWPVSHETRRRFFAISPIPALSPLSSYVVNLL